MEAFRSRFKARPAALLAAAALGVVLVFLVLRAAGRAPARPPVKATLSMARALAAAPVLIAAEKGYFAREGLDVRTYLRPFGKICLDEVIAGKADFGTAAETPVMFAAFKGTNAAVVATFESSRSAMPIVARKDKGIRAPGDLRSRRIGITRGTNVEFLLDTFLVYHGLKRSEVTIVDLPPGKMLEFLTLGKIDAASTWEPVVSEIRRALGDRVILFNDGIYRETFNVVVRRDFARKNPETVKRFLRGLLEAQRFIKENPDEARRLVAERLGFDDASLAEAWGAYDFDLGLDQSLITTLEDEARWAVRNGLVKGRGVPDFMEYIHTDALASVWPEAVTIIR